jgi:hypothetical protein
MDYNMDSRWVAGLTTEEARETRRKEVQSFERVFSELRAILEKEMRSSNEVDFTSPSWAYKQAHTIGHNQALTTVLNLIKDK